MNVYRLNLDLKFILRILLKSSATELMTVFSPCMEYMPFFSSYQRMRNIGEKVNASDNSADSTKEDL